ncbi:unnamed protein product [Colletotrichum noveboracense]|uniref:Uncharacterized protein n=1 Tax=Colletotrichum noveboracense TaxID=2664923 RepID=A0A9W4WHI2_9PEZI|nr:unnamed protein product [Colletotrichum noveboracense]
MRPVSLFVLPRELRDLIYAFYVSIDGGYVCDTDSFIRGKLKGAKGDRIHLSLVYTCKRVAEEMDRGGLALRLDTITFSPISEESLGWLAGSFQRKKDALDRTRLAMLQTVGYCIPDAVYSEMATAYPRLLPLLDRLKREGRRSPLEATLLAMERRGPYGEAPSVYREFVKDVLQNSIEPWTIPSDTQVRRLESELPVYQSHRAGLTADRSIYRFSAAAAAIYFLEAIPHENRTHLRKIILDEKNEAVSNPECHARGLIPFCQEYPLLRIERRVSLWRNIFQEDVNYLDPERRCVLKDRPTPAFLNSDQITGNVASWIVEAMALLPAGMPAKSFSLLLDGDPAPALCSEIFQCIVQRDVAWQLAWDMSLKKKLLPEITWFEKKGESVIRHGHYTNTDVHQHQRFPILRTGFWGYFFEDFPQGFSNIGKDSFPVHCNFDTGIACDVEEIFMQHGRWDMRKWEQEWFRHQPPWWETAPPLPEWMALLKENVMEDMKHMPYLKRINDLLA